MTDDRMDQATRSAPRSSNGTGNGDPSRMTEDALSDRRALIALVHEMRAALAEVRSSVIFMVGFQHGRQRHMQDPNTCDDVLCQSERRVTAHITESIALSAPFQEPEEHPE